MTSTEYNKKYYQENKERERERCKKWYHENKDKLDKEKLKEYHSEYYQSNKEMWKRNREQRDRRNAQRREKYATDLEYKERQKAKVKEWQAANPTKRKAQRIKKYSLSFEEYESILSAHEGKCAICGYTDRSNKKFFPMIDHDHDSLKVRGILCSNCNMAIGKMKDNPALLRKAAEYLEKGGFFNGEVANLV